MTSVNNSKVEKILDYQMQKEINVINGIEKPFNHLPKSDVIQFFLKDGTKITVRPSGTEPKIKFYLGVKEELTDRKNFEEVNQRLENKLKNIITSLKLN